MAANLAAGRADLHIPEGQHHLLLRKAVHNQFHKRRHTFVYEIEKPLWLSGMRCMRTKHAPDITFDDPDDDNRKIFMDLDGLSKHIHGNTETRERDIQIRIELQAQQHDVIVITAAELVDQRTMTRHFKRRAHLLIGNDAVKTIEGSSNAWFSLEETVHNILPFKKIEVPTADQMWKTCIPIYDMRIAACSFGDGQAPEPNGWAEVTGKKCNISII